LPDLPAGVYLEEDHIVLNPNEGRDDALYYKDPYVYPAQNATVRHPGEHAEVLEPPGSTGWGLTVSVDRTPSDGENSTTSAMISVPILAGGEKLYAEAWVGDEGQNVGTLRKKRLEEAIYQCLLRSCPLP
jgi:hypothetical protein